MKPQLKVKSSALERSGNRFFFRGEPFTGIALEEEGGLIVEAATFERGERRGPYRTAFFEVPEEALHVVSTCPDIEGSKDYPEIIQFRFRGEVFSGVYYEFQNEFCIYEGLIADGFAEVETDWYVNGDLEAYAGPDGDFNFDRGFRLRYLCVSKNKNCALQVQFSEAGSITSMRILGDIFQEMGPIVARMPFQFITQVSDLARYKAADRLSLRDLGCDNALLALMLKAGCLEGTSDLSLSNVKISPEQIQHLGELPNLKEIAIYDRDRRLEAAVRELRNQRPDLAVDYKSS